ncbi:MULTISPECIES: hypothetical protein [Micromonospora]|uniref:Ribosomal protein L7/L12 C-terminal domain-containing protein n=1 Tax=Micromonospora yangpuensis TaxID=683228 RepID=A0A1C6UDR9_9ACTN|nr:hypothetical protein [Micromonospora yangpuensis]GGM27221.1 hypothetical protein GCM10012279_52230 [Micromonospora yangpuensis]SCL52187.1 Ribosomal protein L7/L12 C-terminal domain-containing protein [Micromonospora yangpuensis]
MELILSSTALVLGLVLLLASRGSKPSPRQAYRLSEIERKLQLVMDHLGVVDNRPIVPGVREHLDRGEKIKAIKAYREATGADLRTAKEAVEALMPRS